MSQSPPSDPRANRGASHPSRRVLKAPHERFFDADGTTSPPQLTLTGPTRRPAATPEQEAPVSTGNAGQVRITARRMEGSHPAPRTAVIRKQRQIPAVDSGPGGAWPGGATREERDSAPAPEADDPFFREGPDEPPLTLEQRRARARQRKQQARHTRRTAQREVLRERGKRLVAAKPVRQRRPARHVQPEEMPEAVAAPPARAAAPAKPRRNWRRVIVRSLLGVMVLGVFAGGGYALTAPEFAISSVQVKGVKTIPTARLREVLKPVAGQNIFRLRTGALEQKLAALPGVAHADVVRQLTWPPKVGVVITESQPVARIGGGGNWWVVDQRGVPFRRALGKGSGDEELRAITGPKLQPQEGKPLSQADWRRAQSLITALRLDEEASGLPWNLRRVQFGPTGAASLRLIVEEEAPAMAPAPTAVTSAAEGAAATPASSAPVPSGPVGREVFIRLGEGEWEAKLERAREALDYFKRTGRRAAILDLSSYEKPTWTPVQALADPAVNLHGTGVTGARGSAGGRGTTGAAGANGAEPLPAGRAPGTLSRAGSASPLA